MTTLQKLATGIVAIGMVTTLILPKRQTSKVITSTAHGFRAVLSTAMGTGKAV